MHNLLETQEIEKLGYSPGRFTRISVFVMEWLLAHTTRLMVPLPSQSAIAKERLHANVRHVIFPFIEGAYASEILASRSSFTGAQSTQRIVFFGTWGPQKDLKGALDLIRSISADVPNVQTVVAGPVNMHFPEFVEEVRAMEQSMPPDRLQFVGIVPEENLPDLFLDASLAFMPYRATGGYSAALNVAAALGTRVVAYNVKELIEFDKLIAAGTVFIDPLDVAASRETLTRILRMAPIPWVQRLQLVHERTERCRKSVEEFTEYLASLKVESSTQRRSQDS